ncbi:ABC transporter ATP-binding protein [Labrys sp. WJW]|uniref:ABC transporter ATP-binding protein n=1 Tax=Labrys sp. WJW TaxID=1737983 RepID=UPI00082C7294|nr:ABC transporter ATP-binding protein [Labrys sp. WJW]OCC01204.1 ABC transporter ATP-binding protein [Labrys sp. WJW]
MFGRWFDRRWRHLPRLFLSLWRVSPGLGSVILAVRILCALQPPLVIYVGKLIVDEIVQLNRLPMPGEDLAAWMSSGRLTPIMTYIGLEFLLTFGNTVLTRATTLAESLLGERHGNAMAIHVIEHGVSMDLAQIESSDFQNRMQRAVAQTAMGTPLLAQLLGQAQNIVTVIALAVGLIAFVPGLMILLLAALIPALFGEAHFNARRYGLSHHFTPLKREAEYMRFTGADPRIAKEIKLFRLGGFFARRFGELAAEIHCANQSLAIRHAAWSSFLGGIASVAYYAAYAVVTWQAILGEISLGDLVFLTGSLLRLSGLFERTMLGFVELADRSYYLDDFYSFLDTRPSIKRASNPEPMPHAIRNGIVFENVGFRYPGRESWVIRNLNFHLMAGRTLALVGDNGAGKTTIVKLLTRLHDPDEGRILLDGIDIRNFDLEAYRDRIGAVFQDFARYNLAAATNIAAGRITALAETTRIEEAARKSLADRVVAGFPLGYQQRLGNGYMRGHDLSGGEWQRIAIARSYFRNADILILDEPTAALDARAEAEVFERFRNLSVNRTVLLISHRFSTVRMADHILVLECGQIIEEGSHRALIERNGRYAELFHLQAAAYQ